MTIKSQDRPQTGEEALRWAVSFLKGCGFTVQNAWQEARLLLAFVWRKTTLQLLVEQQAELDEVCWKKYLSLLESRGAFTPLHYLLGEKEFMSLPFKVEPAVLIPRGDTETLVEEALKILRSEENPKVLDLGTGSGVIAISLAYYLPQARVVATDISVQALEIARENANSLGVAARIEFYAGDLFSPLPAGESFSLIASNPPYLNALEMGALPLDVQKEPVVALAGGADGLAYYRAIASQAGGHLAPGGHLLLEIGYQQALSVSNILQAAGFSPLRIVSDLEGRDRVVVY